MNNAKKQIDFQILIQTNGAKNGTPDVLMCVG